MILNIIFIIVIVILAAVLWKYQRQMKDICRQIAFLREHDSNMLITTQIQAGGVSELAEELNELLLERKRERREYLEKEGEIARIYTDLSHDIRTPLTSLDGYFQLLRETRDPVEQERYIRIIQERIVSLKELLEELFTYTKLQGGGYEIEMTVCRLNRILKETLFSYYEEWLELGIEPEFSISDEEIQVEAGSQALRRVIQNLIKNGMDHGEKKIHIALERQDDRAVMTFANQVACPEKIDTEHVFDRFYKADEARSRTSTGLGLSIARELVLRMKGTITARMEGNWFVAEVQFPALTAEKDKNTESA